MTDKEILEKEIGGAGAEPEKTSLGKIQHAEVYGKKSQLSEEEKASMDRFLKKGKDIKEKEANIEDGWIPVDREQMGIRSIFYPSTWEFMIRPATVQAIKNWLAVDEERSDQLNKVFNEIIKSCVRINTNDGTGAGWAQINSWDRFWFILKVREYTFNKGETSVNFEGQCSECGADMTYKLTSDSLFYEFPDEELIEKYWTDGVWEIDPREYGVDHDPITLYTPKLGKDTAIIDWAINKARATKSTDVDETFLQFLTWMINKPSRDPQMFEKQVQKAHKEYKSWDVDMFQFMSDVVRNITINQSERMRCQCPECRQEATSDVQFPNGIKVLFEAKSGVKKFGSR